MSGRAWTGAAGLGALAIAAVALWWRTEPEPQSDPPGVPLSAEGPGYVLALYGYETARIPAGEFWMGSHDEEPYRSRQEVRHPVRITEAFHLGTTEVTQALWQGVMHDNPSENQVHGYENELCAQWGVGPDLPVSCVSFDEVIAFLNVLSELEGLPRAYRRDKNGWRWDESAGGYRLPTEAEWEYAARAGGIDVYSGASRMEDVCEVGNLATRATKERYPNWLKSKVFECEDSHLHLAPVGSYRSNAWGLYDMTGNVREWVWDSYALYPTDTESERVEPGRGVTRGGGWTDGKHGARVAARAPWAREDRQPVNGFRIARTATP